MAATALSRSASDRVTHAPVAWLTTLRQDGSPHTTPVWFVFLTSDLWVATGEHNVKVTNLRSDPRVSVAIDGSSMLPLVAQGSATFARTPDTQSLRELFATKYRGWDIADDSVDGPRVLLRITVDRWLLSGSE